MAGPPHGVDYGAASRSGDARWTHAPLFCSQQPKIRTFRGDSVSWSGPFDSDFPPQTCGLSSTVWTITGFERRYELMQHCHGVVMIASAQWRSQRLYRDERGIVGTSEFSHVASSMAVAAGKPLLVLRDKDVAPRGSLKEGYVRPVVLVPSKAGPDWLTTSTFQDPFKAWLEEVRQQRHVFLGYSSGARAMADSLHRFLVGKLRLKVLKGPGTTFLLAV